MTERLKLPHFIKCNIISSNFLRCSFCLLLYSDLFITLVFSFNSIIILICYQVRVPTHEDGTCLFWEFATDNYDLGFGVYFEWTIAPSNQVSVHVSESSDEEELEEEEGGGGGGEFCAYHCHLGVEVG